MNYPQISKGLKLVFFGEMVELLGVAATSLLVAIGSAGAMIGSAAAFLAANIAAGILMIRGLYIAGKTQSLFATAWQIVAGLVLAEVLAGVLSLFPTASSFFHGGLSEIVITIMDVMSTMCVLQGITACYDAIGAKKGGSFIKLTTTLFIIKLIAGIIVNFWSSLIEASAVLLTVFTIAFAIVELLSYIFWLCCLFKASGKIGKAG